VPGSQTDPHSARTGIAATLSALIAAIVRIEMLVLVVFLIVGGRVVVRVLQV
jgi:hypothetical protein